MQRQFYLTATAHSEMALASKVTLLNVDEFRIVLDLYMDEFEVANPLGTSKKKHKLCVVYWVFDNLDSKYHSALHPIELSLLGKVSTVKIHGCQEVLSFRIL